MAESNKVLIRSTPTIKPHLFEFADFESSQASKDDKKMFNGELTGFTQRRGIYEPVVMVGKVKLSQGSIKALSLWQNDLLPTISITFIDDGHIFTSRGYPISNITVSVFIQSPVKKLKSMAADFLITSVSSMPIPDTQSVIYTLSGELNVPILNGNYSNSYANMTSIQVLQQVAKEMQLGFADNQPEGTNDLMTWIMPNYTYKSFLKHVTKFAYKDDNNFFDFFIDRYYVLNFINVEKQFSRDKEIDTGYMALDQTQIDKRRTDPEKDDETEIEVPLILTNYPDAAHTEFFITDFSMTSNHGEILKNHAIRKYAYWYEHGENPEPDKNTDDVNFHVQFIEPLTSTIENDGTVAQTVTISDYINDLNNPKTESDNDPKVTSGVWSGINYGNAHSQYKFAELINHHNWLETEKNTLGVTLSGFNVNILRGSRIRVDIFLDRQAASAANVLATDNDPESKKFLNNLESGDAYVDGKASSVVYDRALSDFYYVSAMSYQYINGKFETSLSLSRRQWMKQPENKVNT
jgi:hypothetical protein